jgi:hypothetical protein
MNKKYSDIKLEIENTLENISNVNDFDVLHNKISEMCVCYKQIHNIIDKPINKAIKAAKDKANKNSFVPETFEEACEYYYKYVFSTEDGKEVLIKDTPKINFSKINVIDIASKINFITNSKYNFYTDLSLTHNMFFITGENEDSRIEINIDVDGDVSVIKTGNNVDFEDSIKKLIINEINAL